MKKILNFIFIFRWLFYFPFWVYELIKFSKKMKIMKNLSTDAEFKKALQVFYETNNREIRQDWIGRLYTVVNVPSDIYANESLSATFVMNVVKEIDDLLRPFGVTEILTLETQKFDDSESSYYLLIIDYDLNPLNWIEFLASLFNIIAIITFLILWF